MTPTPEQVYQWSREAGLQDFGHGFSSFRPCDNSIVGGEFVRPTMTDLQRLVIHAMQVQAEADAKLCDAVWRQMKTLGHAGDCAAAIRANAPTLDN